MTVIIINPNSTATMTDAMVAQAQKLVPDLRFEGWTSHLGPPAIQGVKDGEVAAPPLLDLVKRASKAGADGIIIGCFDDTALEDAVHLATCPVIGIGQASYHYAALRSLRFSVVTTLSVSVPIIEANIERQGLAQYVSAVRASEIPVLALEDDPASAGETLVNEALLAERQDAISALVLGCAGMADLAERVQNALSIEIIDPVSCAARCMHWLTKSVHHSEKQLADT